METKEEERKGRPMTADGRGSGGGHDSGKLAGLTLRGSESGSAMPAGDAIDRNQPCYGDE